MPRPRILISEIDNEGLGSWHIFRMSLTTLAVTIMN